MIKSALKILEDIALESCIKALADTSVMSLLEAANHEATKGEKPPVSQSVEKAVRPAVARGSVVNVIHMRDDYLPNLQDVMQLLKSSLLRNQSFTTSINYLVGQHEQVVVTAKAKFYEQSVTPDNQEE